MTPAVRRVVCGVAVAAVVALAVDWEDHDWPRRRQATPRRSPLTGRQVRLRPVPGCACTPCKAMRGAARHGTPLVLRTPSPDEVAAFYRQAGDAFAAGRRAKEGS